MNSFVVELQTQTERVTMSKSRGGDRDRDRDKDKKVAVKVSSNENRIENYLESRCDRQETNGKDIRKWYIIEVNNFRDWWMHRYNHVMVLQYTTKQTNSYFNYNLFLDHQYFEPCQHPTNCVHFHYDFGDDNNNGNNNIKINGKSLICTDYVMKNYLDPNTKQNDISNAKNKFNKSSHPNFNIFLCKNCVIDLICTNKKFWYFANDIISKYHLKLNVIKEKYKLTSKKRINHQKEYFNMMLFEKLWQILNQIFVNHKKHNSTEYITKILLLSSSTYKLIIKFIISSLIFLYECKSINSVHNKQYQHLYIFTTRNKFEPQYLFEEKPVLKILTFNFIKDHDIISNIYFRGFIASILMKLFSEIFKFFNYKQWKYLILKTKWFHVITNIAIDNSLDSVMGIIFKSFVNNIRKSRSVTNYGLMLEHSNGSLQLEKFIVFYQS